MDPFDVFDAGHMAIMKYPREAVFNIFQPKQHIGAEVMQEPRIIIRVELMARDTGQAAEFYENLLAVETGPMEGGAMPSTLMKAGSNDVPGMINISDVEFETSTIPSPLVHLFWHVQR